MDRPTPPLPPKTRVVRDDDSLAKSARGRSCKCKALCICHLMKALQAMIRKKRAIGGYQPDPDNKATNLSPPPKKP